MLIGVAGYARSGKDEVGKALARRGFTVTRFSQALKDECLRFFPRTIDAIAGVQGLSAFDDEDRAQYRRWLLEDAKPQGIRELLQEMGTEVRRGDDPDYWVKRWAEAIDPKQDTVVVDVRFPNEAEAIRKMGGKVWRVVRPGVGPLHDHASELQNFPVEYAVHNDGTLEDLDVVVGRLIGR
jgi:hypothetical protein